MAQSKAGQKMQEFVLQSAIRDRSHTVLVASIAIFFIGILLYLFFLPQDLQYKFDYYHAEIIFLSAIVLLYIRSAMTAQIPRATLFWKLMSVGFGTWLFASLFGILTSNLPAPQVALVKDILFMVYYSLISVAIELRLDKDSRLTVIRQHATAALGSVLLIFAAFAYFGVLPLLSSDNVYSTPYGIHASIDLYLTLRFLMAAFQTNSLPWRRLFFGFSAVFFLIVCADALAWFFRQEIFIYQPGRALNLIWYIWFPIAMFLSLIRLDARGSKNDDSEDTKISVATRGLVVFGLLLPLIHVMGYGTGYFQASARQLRDILVSGWILLTIALIFAVYFYFRDHVAELDEQRGEAEDKATQFEYQLTQELRIRSLGRLSAGLAHDFGNSLTAISIFAEKIRKENDPSVKTTNTVEDLIESVRYAKDIVAKLRLFGNTGEKIPTKLLNFNAEISMTVEILSASLPSSVGLKLYDDHADLYIHAEPPMVHQVLTNYVYNAVDAMSAAGEITITVEELNANLQCASCGETFGGRFAGLEVNDSGSGVGDTLVKLIFEPLVSTKSVNKGSGLGLSMVHTIMHDIGGHVAVSNNRIGGACFGAYFPIAEDEM